MLTQSGLSTGGWSGDTRGLGNPESRGLAGGDEIRIQIWQYIPMYPAIIPIYAPLSDTLGVLRI